MAGLAASITTSPSFEPIDSVAAAQRLIAHFGHVMNALLAMIQQETELVRAGRLSDVARLEPGKAELARLYMSDVAVVKAHSGYLTRSLPTMVEDLRHRHDAFQALLQINLTVLATVHAVSEGIIRGVAGEFARKAAPETYGMSGRATAPRAGAAQPFALSRRL